MEVDVTGRSELHLGDMIAGYLHPAALHQIKTVKLSSQQINAGSHAVIPP